MSVSKHVDEKMLHGLNKMGDCMIPGDSRLASFSGSNCIWQIDHVLDHMPVQDLNDLKGLLSAMAMLPKPVISLFLKFLELTPFIPGAALLRFARIGIRGLVMTLYYSNPETLRKIGYEVTVYTGDQKNTQPSPR